MPLRGLDDDPYPLSKTARQQDVGGDGGVRPGPRPLAPSSPKCRSAVGLFYVHYGGAFARRPGYPICLYAAIVLKPDGAAGEIGIEHAFEDIERAVVGNVAPSVVTASEQWAVGKDLVAAVPGHETQGTWYQRHVLRQYVVNGQVRKGLAGVIVAGVKLPLDSVAGYTMNLASPRFCPSEAYI
jgi:hypothetical protein